MWIACSCLLQFYGLGGFLDLYIVDVLMVREGADSSHNLTLRDEVMSMQ